MFLYGVQRLGRAKNLQIACKYQSKFFAVRLNKGGSGLLRHVWKACSRQNRLAGSNPVLSAD